MRRNLVSSPENAVRAALNAAKEPLRPPMHVALRVDDMPFWSDIMGARARDDWTKADLVMAAQLARCMRDIEVETVLYNGEGSMLENSRGTRYLNPRQKVIAELQVREMRLMQTLRMGGRHSGDARIDASHAFEESKAQAVQHELREEELLA